MFQLIFFAPADHVEKVKDALFAVGVGKVGAYDRCSWQILGDGQFRPLAGASPYLGKLGEVTEVKEYRVEMVCDESVLSEAVSALRQAHPYEEPAYCLIRMF